MLEQLVECENRLLEEQRRFNELLLAYQSGDLGDDLTRMKIEQMQREVDALGRQLTALRTVIAAQADRERAGYRQGAMPKAAYGQPAYGQPVSATQPWDQTMPQPAAQTAESGNPIPATQGAMPQPAREPGNPIPPAQGAMSQPAQEPGNPQQAYQRSAVEPGMPQQTAETGKPIPAQGAMSQQAYQQTPPRQAAAQAGYQQASGKQDLEKTIGRAILPVCAAGLIFLSLVFFAMLVLPHLSQGVKMILMYTVSAAITLAGGILVAHDRRNKAFLGLLGCGMGAWYLSLFLSDFYFHAINDGILYLGLLVWAVVLCVLSRLRSNLFLIIGQIGVGISLILGVLMCNWTEDAERFLILSIYYAVTQTVFFVSHLRREYYRNAVNLVSWSIGLLILVFGAAASYTEGSAAGTASVVLLLVLASVPVLLGCILEQMDENGKLLGGIVGVLCIFIFSGLFLDRFTGAALLLLVFGIAVLALLEFRRPGDLSAGTVLLEVAVFAQMFFAGAAAPYFGEYVSTGLLAEACLLYGFLRKRKAYRAAALGYGILLLLIPMNGGMRTVWGLVFFGSAVLLIGFCREQYEIWMKICGYLMFLAFLLETAVWATDLAAVADVYLSDLICFMPIVLCNILAAKVPLFRRNPKTGEEEKTFTAATMAVQAILIAAVLVLMGKPDAPVLRLIYVLLGLVLVCTNTYSLLIRKDGDWWGIYVALKLLLFASVALHSYGVPVFVNDVTGIVIAFCCIVAGFLAEMRMERKYKALRVCGLVLVLLCVVKLVLVDIRYDNVLLRAAGFFVGGILCFGISIVYNLVDKRMGRRENTKN